MPDFLEGLIPLVTVFAAKVVGALVALWVTFRIARMLDHRLSRVLDRRGVDKTLIPFLSNLVRWLFVAAAILAILGLFGIETTSFAAVLAAAGLAIGLAFQGTLSNFAAGVMLLTFRPFSVGQFIEAAGQAGIVAEIGLFVTALDTPDNRRIYVPNGAVMSGVIQNYSHHEFRRVDIDVGVAYEAPIAKTREILDRVAAAQSFRDPDRGHEIVLMNLGPSSVDWQVHLWTKASDFLAAKQALTTELKDALDQAGVNIPFPQMDVHLKNAPITSAPKPLRSPVT